MPIASYKVCSAFTHVTACTLALSPIRDTHSEGFSLYEAPPVKRFFLRSTFSDSDSPLRSLRAHVCIHGNGSPVCLAAPSGQPPLARKGRALQARGVDGESARRAEIVLPCIAATLVLLFPMISKAEPLSAMRHSPHPLISGWGQAPLVPRSLLQQCEGIGLQGGWDPSILAAY
jgi:hypothetical protein